MIVFPFDPLELSKCSKYFHLSMFLQWKPQEDDHQETPEGRAKNNNRKYSTDSSLVHTQSHMYSSNDSSKRENHPNVNTPTELDEIGLSEKTINSNFYTLNCSPLDDLSRSTGNLSTTASLTSSASYLLLSYNNDDLHCGESY